MSRPSKPKAPKPAAESAAPAAPQAATEVQKPEEQVAAADAARAATEQATKTESTLGDGDATGAAEEAPSATAAPEAPASDVGTDPGDSPQTQIPEDWVAVSAVSPDTPLEDTAEVVLTSAVDHDGMSLRPGNRIRLLIADADALVRAGAATIATEDAA